MMGQGMCIRFPNVAKRPNIIEYIKCLTHEQLIGADEPR